MKWFNNISVYSTVLFMFCVNLAYAQPANDDCSNAETLVISDAGFARETIVSTTINLRDATTQLGEVFHSSMISAGNDKQSVWFKFSLPTTRAVKIALKQSAVEINEADVGFTVYKSSTCLPTLAEIEPAKLTSVNKFGSTFNECIPEGDYFIQVGSKNGIDTTITIELTTSYPFEVVSHDYGALAYDYTTISSEYTYYPSSTGLSLDLGCYSIDSTNEMACSELGADYQDYKQTIYQVFTTDDFIDALRFELKGVQSSVGKIGVKILEGDVRINPVGSLLQVGNCEVVNVSTEWKGFNVLCQLKANTTYSIQLNVHESQMSKNLMSRIAHVGIGITKGANPASLPANNLMGTLPSSALGEITIANDVLSCISFIDTSMCSSCDLPQDNLCGTVNPAGAVTVGSALYELSTWYTFTIVAAADIVFSTQNYTRKRLFTGDVTGDCNLAVFYESTSSTINYQCLPSGTYSMQILGKVDRDNNILNPSYSQLGRTANLSIKVTDLHQVNDFNLSALGRVDELNALMPMPDGINFSAATDQFGCDNTSMPSTQDCGASRVKASYRVFVIGDADGDLALDSGIVTIPDWHTGWRAPYIPGNLYEGNAATLAAAQGYPGIGSTITGLTNIAGCFQALKRCITPGEYTLVSLATVNHIGITDRPSVQFDIVNTQYKDPENPYDFGDITASIAGGNNVDHSDIWDCYENPLTVAGVNPCGNKQIYRQFTTTTPLLINITGGSFIIYEGKISDLGAAGVSVHTPFGTSCRNAFNQGLCTYLPAGDYTVVSYGNGGTYAGPDFTSSIGGVNTLIIATLVEPIAKKYELPSKAYQAGITDYGPNAGSTAYPNTSKTYTFDTEYFNCMPDTPFAPSPGVSCGADYNRTAYYTFELTQESYFHISGTENYKAKLFKLDARNAGQAATMAGATPVQTCINETQILDYDTAAFYCTPAELRHWYGNIEVCRAQAGVYTLVIFATDGDIGNLVTPTLYVNKIEESTHDVAWNAYDFGIVPTDSLEYFNNASTGDASSVSGREASSDFFSCKTGANTSDPDSRIGYEGRFPQGNLTSVDYPMGINTATYQNLTTTNLPTRRNLWYTYQIDGPGEVSVSVYNKTTGKTKQVAFAIYKSDETSTVDFANLKIGNLVDSTLADGLTLVETNRDACYSSQGANKESISYTISPCVASAIERYYIIVDNNVHDFLTNQIDVSIKFNPLTPIMVRYDYYAEANVINGLNQINPPYTSIALDSGVYAGDTGTFACATYDSILVQYEGNTTSPCEKQDQSSLWYTFEVDISGKLRFNYQIVGGRRLFDANNLILYKEIVAGDSTEPGLEPVPLTAMLANGLPWGEGCMSPGRYYFLLTGCSYEIDAVQPYVWVYEEQGDLCASAVSVHLDSLGSTSNIVTIDCHSMGDDFGEDAAAPNMGCLFGPDGYKSTWYRVTLGDTAKRKLDITLGISENTTAFANQIRYRMLYGSCTSMTAGPCNTDGGTSFTLNCMSSDSSDYYIQVVSPVNATGTIQLNLSAVESADPLCEALDPFKPVANFIQATSCQGDSVCFSNFSTAGDSIEYAWDFGDAATSTLTSPCHLFTASGNEVDTFDVRLIVTNIEFDSKDTVDVPIYLFKKPSSTGITRDAPYDADTALSVVNINFYGNVANKTTAPATTYNWVFGSNGDNSSSEDPVYQYPISALGLQEIVLEIANGTCIVETRDSINIGSEPIFNGGFYDGSKQSIIASFCILDTLEDVWAGGFYDGADETFEGSLCVLDTLENVWTGGFYDGTEVTLESSICLLDTLELVWNGGYYDGADVTQMEISITIGGVIKAADTICVGGSKTIVANTGVGTHTYLWSTGETTSSITVSPIVTTTYTLIDSVNVAGCLVVTNESIIINVIDLHIIELGNDTSICAGDTILLGESKALNTVYAWTPSATLNYDTVAQPTATPIATTKYIVTLSDVTNLCPSVKDSIIVTPTPVIVPTVTAPNDTMMCITTPITLTATVVADNVDWYKDVLAFDITVTGGTPSSSSDFSSSYRKEYAFDGDTITQGWASNPSLPQWLGVNYGSGSGKIINKYRIYCSSTQADWPSSDYNPKTWTVQGSNDNTTWVTLHTVADGNISNDVSKEFTFSNTTTYEYYKIDVSASKNSASYTRITELILSYEFNPTSLSSTTSLVVSTLGTYIMVVSNNGGCTEDVMDTVVVGDLSGAERVAYRTKQDGDWTDLNTWQIYNNTTSMWEDATAFTGCGGAHYPSSKDSTILVQHNVIYNITIPQGIDETTVSSVGVVTIPSAIELKMVDSSGSAISTDIDNYGEIYVTGTFTQVSASALLTNEHNSTVIYNGVNQNMWNGQYGKLEVDGGGIKTVMGTITSVTNDVLFIDGHIQLGNRNFRLWDAATTTGATTGTGWFITNAFGSVYKLSVGATMYNFEVGTSTTSFNRLNVTNDGTTDNYKIRVSPPFDFDSDYPCDALTDTASVNRTWYINEDAASGSDLNIEAYWNTSDENTYFNRSASYVGEYQSGLGWVRIGALSSAPIAGGLYSQTATNITNPNTYSVGSCLGDKFMYKTIADGDWTNTNIWNIYIDELNDWYPPSSAPCTCGPAYFPTSSDSTIQVYHDVLYDSTISIGIDELNIEPTGTLTVIDDTLLIVDGPTTYDLDNQGTLVLGDANLRLVTTSTWINRDNSTVHYNGLSQDLWAVQYGNLWIDGPSASPMPTVIKTLTNTGLYVRNDLKFIHGMIHLTDYDLLMDDSSKVKDAGSSTGWVDATGLGYFVWNFPVGTNITKRYPVGGQYYSWDDITFQNVTQSGTLKGRVREFDHPTAPGTPIHRYWTMTKDANLLFTGTYDIRMKYDDFDLPNTPIDAADELKQIEVGGAYSTSYSPSNWRLSSVGTVAYLAQPSINQGLITNNAFSDFTLMTFTDPLPFEQLVFNGKLNEENKSAYLYWTTYQQNNNYGFELERSVDGINFSTISDIKGKENPSSEEYYDYTDEELYELNTNVVYYRLKQEGLDGSVNYSKVIALPIPEETSTEEDVITAVYPNPTRRNMETIVLYELQEESSISIEVFSVLGQKSYHKDYETLGRGKYKLTVPTNDLAPGTYIIRVSSDRNQSVKRLIVVE